MKDNIHPQYGYVVFRDRSTGKAFLTRSTLVAKAASLPTIEWEDGNTYSLVNVEVSSYSHPFYTGRNVVLDTPAKCRNSTSATDGADRAGKCRHPNARTIPTRYAEAPAGGSWLAKRD